MSPPCGRPARCVQHITSSGEPGVQVTTSSFHAGRVISDGARPGRPVRSFNRGGHGTRKRNKCSQGNRTGKAITAGAGEHHFKGAKQQQCMTKKNQTGCAPGPPRSGRHGPGRAPAPSSVNQMDLVAGLRCGDTSHKKGMVPVSGSFLQPLQQLQLPAIRGQPLLLQRQLQEGGR